ncbi:hypothetical protein MMPV_002128 [Pyropia vietnamensis]
MIHRRSPLRAVVASGLVVAAAAAAVATTLSGGAVGVAAGAAGVAGASAESRNGDGPHAHLPLLELERRDLAARIAAAGPGETVHFEVSDWVAAMKNYHVELSPHELAVLSRGGTSEEVAAGLEEVRLAGNASVRAVAPPLTSGLCTTDYRTRKEAGDMWPGERWAWTQAMLKIHQLKGANNRSIFEQLVELHSTNAAEAHGSVQFLPWHYFFLIIVETALRAVDQYLTLPYWAWSRDALAPYNAPVWEDWFLGKTVSGQCIQTGPFVNFTTNVPVNHCVLRGFTSGPAPGGSMDFALEDEATVNALVADADLTFPEWSDTWEIAHGGPHLAVGGATVRGDMYRVSRSPNDPVFYLHHAYVEKVWRDRQAAQGASYSGTHRGTPVSVNDRLAPFDLPVWRAVWDRCVWYQPTTRSFPGGAPAASGRVSRSTRVRQSALLKEFFRSNGLADNVEKVDAAQEVLAKATEA